MGHRLLCDRLVVGPLAANCYIIGCDETGDAVVIDPGDEGARIIESLTRRNLNARFIIDTHGHFDHTGANAFIKNKTKAVLAIHIDDAPLLATQQQHAASWGIVVPPSPPPDRLLSNGDVIEFGHHRLEVIHTPGHSPGGICLCCDEFLVVGDTLFAGSIGRTDLPGGNHQTLLDAIRTRLLPLGDDLRVLPGHGEATTIGNERVNNPFLANLIV